jgi:hypothetical protein
MKPFLDPIDRMLISRAVERFNPLNMEVGQLICSTEVADTKLIYKLFKIGEGTVEIALPDMVMVTVPVASLYDPNEIARVASEHIMAYREAEATKDLV